MKKKLFALLLAVIVALGVAFAFSACSGGKTVGENPPASENPPVGGIGSDGEDEPSITFADFIKDHSDKARSLYNQKFSALSAEVQTLGRYVSIGATSNDELNAVTVARIYKVDDTKRKIDIVKASLLHAVDLDDIVDGSVGDILYTTQITPVFEFDVKENKLNGDVAEVLYQKAGLESDLKIFSESQSSPLGSNVREFKLLTFKDGVYKTGKISVIVDGNTKENLIQNLNNPNKVFSYEEANLYEVTPEGSALIISEEYNFSQDTYPADPQVPEEGGEGEGGGGENPPEESGDDKQEQHFNSVAQLIAACNDQLFEALDNTFLTRIGRAVYGQTFNAEQLVEHKWDLGNIEQISQIKFTGTYKDTSNSFAYGIGTIELASAITIDDLTKDNIEATFKGALIVANYTENYTLGYAKSIQGTRDSLVEAIFAACGHNLTEDSTRLFLDRGHKTDGVGYKGEAREFIVAEITDKGVNEFTIRVKNSSNDDEYIENLKKEGNYAVVGQESETLSGNFVTKPEN